MRAFMVEEWHSNRFEQGGGHWVFWMVIRAWDRSHAERMILEGNPPKRFRVLDSTGTAYAALAA